MAQSESDELLLGQYSSDSHFWRNCLPRLQYHNPSVVMTVKPRRGVSAPVQLSIFYTNPDSTAPSRDEPSSSLAAAIPGSKPAPDERVVVVDMKNRQEQEILSDLIRTTKARLLQPTAEEVAEMKEMELKRQQDGRNAQLGLAATARRKREEELVRLARGIATKLKEAA